MGTEKSRARRKLRPWNKPMPWGTQCLRLPNPHLNPTTLPLSVTTDGKSSTGCVLTGSQCGVLELSSGRLGVGVFVAQQGAPLSA